MGDFFTGQVICGSREDKAMSIERKDLAKLLGFLTNQCYDLPPFVSNDMRHDLNAISELIGALYEAVACPAQWNEFLVRAAQAFDCDKAAIVLVGSGTEKPSISLTTGMDPEAMKDYNAYYGPKNPVVSTIIDVTRRAGSLELLGRSLNPGREYEKSEYYNDWGRKYGVYHVVHGVGAGEDGSITGLSVKRPKAGGPLEEEALELMALLTPHLKRVVHIHHELERLRLNNRAAQAGLDMAETALIATDGQGRVIFFNETAEILFQRGDGIRLRDGRLSAPDYEVAAALRESIKRAADTGAGRGIYPGGVMLAPRIALDPLHITVVPFHSSYVFTAERPCALVLISDTSAKLSSRQNTLSHLYGLTPAECRLCDLLVDGLELVTAADKMHITANTGRFMLKNIFRKTGTRRQSHLLRFLLLLPPDRINPLKDFRVSISQ